MFNNLFNPLKKYIHQPGEPKLQVRMDITNKCNLMCKMCNYPFTAKEPKYDMEPEVFQKIADQIFPYVEWVALSCQYEAFMSKYIDEILEIASKSSCSRLGIATNAILLTDKRIKQVLENPSIETLTISIDGGTKETYESIRINAKWDKLIENLQKLSQQKGSDKTKRPALIFNTVLMKSTVKELPELVKLAANLGIIRVQAIRYVTINKELDEEISDWESVIDILLESKKIAHNNGIELFLPIEDYRLDIERNTKKEAECNVAQIGKFSSYCEAPWSGLQIFPNGDIYPCGFWDKPFGNIKTQDFLEIWNSKPYLELRKSLTMFKLDHKCIICNPHGYDNMEHKKKINK